MSLAKLIRAPVKLFRKDVITFLIIRRHDLSNVEDKLRYIAVKPSASISVLRQKIWHLLDLPDFCDELIVLKCDDKELPLTELRKGNSPHRPFILEVWPPETRFHAPIRNNMLSLRNCEYEVSKQSSEMTTEKLDTTELCNGNNDNEMSTITKKIDLDSFKLGENKCMNMPGCKFMKSDITCRISSTSLFKLNGRKNRESFTNILLKIQSDLCTLSTKLSNLENRIQL